jgi:hypothetical protein
MPHSTPDHCLPVPIAKRFPVIAYHNRPLSIPAQPAQAADHAAKPAGSRIERTTGTGQGEAAFGLTRGSLPWRHYYHCSCGKDEWVRVTKTAGAADCCPACARRTSPYESEVCLILRP